MLMPMPPRDLTWAALLTLVTAAAGCGTSSGGECNTDELPADDPCYMQSCCDSITVVTLPDGAVEVVPPGEDAGPGTETRFCGACNG